MTDCVIWPKSRTSKGYGQTSPDPGRATRLAHRQAWERVNGPIPEGLTIDHLCRNKACVNVEHLEVVTQRVNILRGNNLAARNARKTHCPEGHSYDEINTYHYGGLRHCRACRRANMRKWRRIQAGGQP